MKQLLNFFSIVLLASVILMDTSFEAKWLTLSNLLYAFFVFAAIGFAWHAYRTNNLNFTFALTWLIPYILVCLLLIGALLAVNESGVANPGRVAKFGIVYLLLLFVLAANAEPLEFFRRNIVYLLAFAIMLGAFFSHLPNIAVGSGLVRFAIKSGTLMGLALFVFPRYVSRDAFFWTISVLSATVVTLSLPMYLFGEYTLFGLSFQLWGTQTTMPLIGFEFRYLQSIFPNPNTTGGLTFAGTVAAALAAYRSYADSSVPAVWILPGMMFLLNGFGLYLSYSRAGWLAAGIALSLYGVYVLFGRNALPIGFTAIIGMTGLFLLAIFLSLIGISSNGRFTLWGAGLQAILNDPSLFGAGLIDPSEPLEPYLTQFRGFSPHNSYISIFLRAGLLGGFAYLVLTFGSVLDGVFRKPGVDAGILAFASGCAIHQMFEAYTLFQYTFIAVCGAIVFGYLILDGSPPLDEVTSVSSLTSRLQANRKLETWSNRQ
ncbi:O-antigen ligase family protein [Halegenticoccus soli]|uniref:O-antigen ligase family protein n=1 Tax=Halegenticoccus soli TaxID=1985678 RepID=UPI000C6E3EAE|nr:O-antigen ligase family protein [Halegenticoccus soli]